MSEYKMVGEYMADYTMPSREEIDAIDSELEELHKNSKRPYNGYYWTLWTATFVACPVFLVWLFWCA